MKNEIMKIRKEQWKKGIGRRRESGEVGFECARCGSVVDVCIE